MLRLKVRELAEAQGMNASQLARKADMSYPPIYKIWNEPYSTVKTDSLVKLARALRVAVSDLYEEVDEEDNCKPGPRQHERNAA